MEFGQQPKTQQSYNQPTVNTNFMSFFTNGIGTDQLRLSANGDKMGISIWVPEKTPDGHTKYHAHNRYNLMLTLQNVKLLNCIIDEIMLPAYEAGNECEAGIYTNARRTSFINLGIDGQGCYVEARLDCNAASATPDSNRIKRFYFQQVQIVKEGEDVVYNVDFLLFVKMIQEFCDTIAGYIPGHGVASVLEQKHTEMMGYLKAIATKLGIEVSSAVTAYSSAPPQAPVQPTAAPSSITITDTEDLPF